MMPSAFPRRYLIHARAPLLGLQLSSQDKPEGPGTTQVSLFCFQERGNEVQTCGSADILPSPKELLPASASCPLEVGDELKIPN